MSNKLDIIEKRSKTRHDNAVANAKAVRDIAGNFIAEYHAEHGRNPTSNEVIDFTHSEVNKVLPNNQFMYLYGNKTVALKRNTVYNYLVGRVVNEHTEPPLIDYSPRNKPIEKNKSEPVEIDHLVERVWDDIKPRIAEMILLGVGAYDQAVELHGIDLHKLNRIKATILHSVVVPT